MTRYFADMTSLEIEALDKQEDVVVLPIGMMLLSMFEAPKKREGN